MPEFRGVSRSGQPERRVWFHNVHTKTALVTGGNRGLGRSNALHLAQDGVDVVLTTRVNAVHLRG